MSNEKVIKFTGPSAQEKAGAVKSALECWNIGYRGQSDMFVCTAARLALAEGKPQNHPSIVARARYGSAFVAAMKTGRGNTDASVGAFIGSNVNEGIEDVKDLKDKVVSVGEFLSKLSDWHTWLRIAEVIVGLALMFYGLKILATGKASPPSLPLARLRR